MSKFKLTQTATEVQDILNNSLQKPTGLTKTELVGVGVNGQENIEIGDNLTLANGKLSATGGGGGGVLTQNKVYFKNTSGKICQFFFFALSTSAPYRDLLIYETGMDNINNWFLHGKERDFLATGYIETDDNKLKPIQYVHVAPTTATIYYMDTTSFITRSLPLPNGQWKIGESIAITSN